MRKESDSSWSSAVDRLRASWGRGRRWFSSRGAATRVGLVVAALAIAGTVGYLGSGEHAPGSTPAALLYEGQRLSSDDLAAITSALEAESIPFRPDFPARRVFVGIDRKTAALNAIAKRKATPTTLGDLNRDDESGMTWGMTPAERERRDLRRLEQSLKLQIEGLDSTINSAKVEIHRDRDRRSLNAHWNVWAYVYLRIDSGTRLGLKAVEGIEHFLVGSVSDLKSDAINMVDQTGRVYMAAGNAPLKEQVRIHSQEEEWSDKIAEGLRHIPGVGVSVSLESVAVPPSIVEEPPPPPASEVVVVNGLLQVAPEPRPAPAPAPTASTKTRANVWVRVPRSFYLMAAQAQSQSPYRRPSAEDLQQMQETTRRIIREAVDAGIPRDLRGELTVATVQDDLSASRTDLLPPGPAQPNPSWLMPAVYSGVGLAMVASVATALRLATKRPTLRPGAGWRPGFVADEPNPGPSERVRELIRLNPEAAAGVLQRWIGQGGAVG